ncbi:MAG: acyl carrier protein [Epulopiscium sp.]|nr:acyl carrier protein [Candidatus Epulonipiscium sp.]
MVFEKLQDIISEELNIPKSDIEMSTSFQDDLNADSLDLFQVIMAIEEEFDLEISNEDAESVTTVETAVELIEKTKELD